MGRQSKIKEVVRLFRAHNPTEDELSVEMSAFIGTLRDRPRMRAMARSAGMETKYTEKSLSKKKHPDVSRGFHRAIKRARRNSPEAVKRVQKTYPGIRVSSGLTRTCYYE